MPAYPSRQLELGERDPAHPEHREPIAKPLRHLGDAGGPLDIVDRQLHDLAGRGEIPDKLVNVALSLKNFGNIGAHAGSGELTPAEIPILDSLSRAVLEYVYSAPELVRNAEQRLSRVKNPRRRAAKS